MAFNTQRPAKGECAHGDRHIPLRRSVKFIYSVGSKLVTLTIAVEEHLSA